MQLGNWQWPVASNRVATGVNGGRWGAGLAVEVTVDAVPHSVRNAATGAWLRHAIWEADGP